MDALALAAALESKKLSAADLMQATLARIEAVNGTVNAVVSLRDADAVSYTHLTLPTSDLV